MGKLDEGLEDFFSKKVIKLSFKLPSVKASSSSVQETSDKKRESRKSGFFNLIKSRTSRSEKSHGAASITPPNPASSTAAPPSSSVSPVSEEPMPTPPTPPAKNPVAVAEPHQELHRAQSSDHVESEMETSPPAAEPAEEEKEEEKEEEESVEKKENPHILRHIGVPVMGMDLLAEMKARQERMAVKKVGGVQYL
uniref:Leucine-rich repeat-containing protein 16A n=1 Tax=Larimichthys crocea TaxID=215358 RepID=A0A0F8AD69_LARCR